jgi:HlyD family secretion protein
VQLKQLADVEIEGKTHRLRVTRIHPQVQNGVFIAELEFEGRSPGGLAPGASLLGKLTLGSDEEALMLPADAFLERTGGDWIFVLDEDGNSARRQRIRVGRRNVEQVEVLEGLEAGQRVVTSDYAGYERIDRLDLTQ